MLPVLPAALLSVSAQAVPPSFSAAQASFLRGSANDGSREAPGGMKPGNDRSETDFDPGAKYHIPGNTPYARCFLANNYQFQFYRALCKQVGHVDMMAMGASRPWPDALEAGTGQRELDATAILEYFAPLKVWLDEQNKGQTVGWTAQ